MREKAAKQERRHREDLVKAGRLGEELGCGAVKTVEPGVRPLSAMPLVLGLSLALIAVTGALHYLIFPPWPAAATVLVPAVFLLGVLLVPLYVLLSPRKRPAGWLSWHSGGLAELIPGEPGPRVIRWAEVDSVTLAFSTDEDTSSDKLDSCTLRDSTGTGITVDDRYVRIRPGLVREADRILSPRLVPPLIRAYESGEPVIIGRDRIDRAGVTHVRGTGKALLTPWNEIRWISVVQETPADPASAIRIGHASGRGALIKLSGVRNGIAIPHLIKYAAEQNGVPLRSTGQADTASPGSAAEPLPGHSSSE